MINNDKKSAEDNIIVITITENLINSYTNHTYQGQTKNLLHLKLDDNL